MRLGVIWLLHPLRNRAGRTRASSASAPAKEKIGRPLRAARGRVFPLVAGAFGRCLRLGHFCRHLGFDCVEIEACAPLHRWVLEEGLEFLAHYLLDEHETPELVL